jgi:uncharacterized protein
MIKTTALAVLLALPFLGAAQPVPPQAPPPMTLSVNGTGIVRSAPDEATVRVGILARASTAAEAQRNANEIMNRYLQRLDALKVPKANIRTSRLFLNPHYTHPRPGEEAVISGYQATNSISVRLTDFALIGQVIDAGIAAGVNTVEGVHFGLRDDTRQRLEALRLAVAEARAKAEAMAEALGMELGPPQEVQEGGAYVAPPPMMMARGASAEMADASTPVEPGELSVHGSVTIRYRLLLRRPGGS